MVSKIFLEELIKADDRLSPRESLDYPAINCEVDYIHDFLKRLREEFGFNFLADITAIDGGEESPRFWVVYHVYKTDHPKSLLRIVTPLDDDAEPSCPSICDLWPAADWHERETYDMFGIHFKGHPDLRRILMWEDYPYYPLRKEFPLAGHETELPADDVVQRTGAKVKPAPMMGGPFHSRQHGSMSKREPRADDESWTEKREKAKDPGPEVTSADSED